MRRVDLIVRDVRRGDLRSALAEILFRHSLWEATGGKRGEQLNLAGANLRKANLREARLDGANCKFTVFLNADFEFADLRGVDTRRAHTDRRPYTDGGLPVNEAPRPSRQQRRKQANAANL
jgi:uncharacterized protein YjbI with pentapeptide repeats